MEIQKPEAQAVAEIAFKAADPFILQAKDEAGQEVDALIVLQSANPNGSPFIVETKKYLDAYRTAPARRMGTAKLTELNSFIAFVNRFKDGDSVLFANNDPDSASLTAVLDYNRAGDDNSKARFGQHRAVYSFPLSEEWKAWSAQDGEPMSQTAFAAFLEDRIADAVEPGPALSGDDLISNFFQKLGLDVGIANPARLLHLSREFVVHANEKVRTALNLNTGEAQIQYEAEHVDQQGTPLKVPGAFVIGVPIFKNGVKYTVGARLRYRVQTGQVSWWFDLYRPDLSFDHAFKEAFEKVEKETGLPLLVGAPEA